MGTKRLEASFQSLPIAVFFAWTSIFMNQKAGGLSAVSTFHRSKYEVVGKTLFIVFGMQLLHEVRIWNAYTAKLYLIQK